MNSVRSSRRNSNSSAFGSLTLTTICWAHASAARRHDRRPGGDVVGVGDRRPGAGAGLDEDVDPAALQLAHAVGRHRHPMLGRLDLLGHANGPDCSTGISHSGSVRLVDAPGWRRVLDLRSMKAFSNFVNGKPVEAVGRADPRRRQSGDRRDVRHGTAVRAGRRRRGDGGGRRGVPRVARHDAVAALARPVPHRRRDRGPRRRAGRRRGREHRQADRPDDVGGDAADDRPDPLLRRRGAPPRGQECRRVHGEHDVVGPS